MSRSEKPKYFTLKKTLKRVKCNTCGLEKDVNVWAKSVLYCDCTMEINKTTGGKAVFFSKLVSESTSSNDPRES